MKKITETELMILDALAGLIIQYMPSRKVSEDYESGGGEKIKKPHKDLVFEHQCMKAGEDASDILMKYGLADDDGYSIVPNDKFYKVMEHNDDKGKIKKILEEINS